MNINNIVFGKYQIIMSWRSANFTNFSGMIRDHTGSKFWIKNGFVHREDEPALIEIDGTKVWYINNKFHRINGPAVEFADGEKQWFIQGIQYSEKLYWKKIKKLQDSK